MTYRDANANDLLDCLDLGHRAFADPPILAAPGNPTGVSRSVPPPTGEQPPLSAFVKTAGVWAEFVPPRNALCLGEPLARSLRHW